MKLKLLVLHLLFQLKQQRKNKGFTLIELLVVIIIIGILSAVALPNLMAQVGKAREAEAREMLSALGQAQQAYFFEKAIFADDLTKLDIAIKDNRGNYYSFPNPTVADANKVKHQATSLNPAASITRNYSLGIYNNSGQFSLVLCQSQNIGGAAEAPDISTDPCRSGNRL
ncbi:hypothetical protein C7Y66_07145 [Chroococcidiopsis sp. CCALA 051]|uniref:type IV pilin-like G/H family protein n=1 Tax=Chroococcidiopsis sp. CCALA 051 TaxID=869949 RepID=UPI000D0DA92D|nr:type IV pilin-like G/H family protein [Chroococcidiopsis sp. CCALA 051]MBE9018738.1 prepilin-type N-terminal cleavage/methylation domain-containing protein [Chroococcidiopsidales cyanobacterium LEGE 13417]PSM49855.1 hypothetical protein C7Y66_07145 [Chroococcidiopsis sp. CCALA 051]